MQKYSNIIKKNRILQIISIIFLFIGLSSVNFANVLPEEVTYSTPVTFLLLAYRIVGFFGLAYLALVFVKNKDIWMMQVTRRSRRKKQAIGLEKDSCRSLYFNCVLSFSSFDDSG